MFTIFKVIQGNSRSTTQGPTRDHRGPPTLSKKLAFNLFRTGIQRLWRDLEGRIWEGSIFSSLSSDTHERVDPVLFWITFNSARQNIGETK